MKSIYEIIILGEALSDKYADSKYDIPVTCKMGLHDWGPWIKQRVTHESSPKDKKRWAHKCDAEKRFCKKCGKNSELRNTCQGQVVPLWGHDETGKVKVENLMGETPMNFIENKY
jgi:hypothetical protein